MLMGELRHRDNQSVVWLGVQPVAADGVAARSWGTVLAQLKQVVALAQLLHFLGDFAQACIGHALFRQYGLDVRDKLSNGIGGGRFSITHTPSSSSWAQKWRCISPKRKANPN
jgi:hypothetical protein